jgi:hypothetical protein
MKINTEFSYQQDSYGLPPDWDLSLVNVNGPPMPAIRAARIVPDYQWMEGEGRLITAEGVY